MDIRQLKRVGVIIDPVSKIASDALAELKSLYDLIDLTHEEKDIECDALISLGGDGLMLKVMHKYMHNKTPIYGMNRGSIGFLMNTYDTGLLMHRIANAVPLVLHPLEMTVETQEGEIIKHLAINEVSLMRQTNQAGKLKISVDGECRINEVVCDGIILATPAGSTAYNVAASGPILPLTSNLLALTPICAFRPRRWRGALLSDESCVEIEILNSEKRPVSASADFFEVRNVVKVSIKKYEESDMIVLFDQENSLHDRILKEQFLT